MTDIEEIKSTLYTKQLFPHPQIVMQLPVSMATLSLLFLCLLQVYTTLLRIKDWGHLILFVGSLRQHNIQSSLICIKQAMSQT